jgi:hypothetical protein
VPFPEALAYRPYLVAVATDTSRRESLVTWTITFIVLVAAAYLLLWGLDAAGVPLTRGDRWGAASTFAGIGLAANIGAAADRRRRARRTTHPRE